MIRNVLFKPSAILKNTFSLADENRNISADSHDAKPEPRVESLPVGRLVFLDEKDRVLTKYLGNIEQGKTYHYYSYANF